MIMLMTVAITIISWMLMLVRGNPDNVLNSLKVKSRIAFQAIYSRRVSTLQCTVEPFELGLLQEVYLEEGQDLGKGPYN